ncbi:putative Sas10 C-terminal domain-containing protein [Seiridium cardinale]|uniref:Sas10 C-terminal domain-containing protein n=1 Tax=Seiridium cardinale TaxID=138064 RepID=A0ABR2Y9B3_9PEZI
MAKKRKAAAGSSEPKGPREYDPKDARLGPVTTYEDVADDQEKYWMDQDAIMFNDGPKSKKQRRAQEDEDFLEASDEEVLGYDQESDSDEDDELEQLARKAKKFSKKANKEADVSESEKGDEEEEDSGWWGSSKKEYYDADQIQTEADALEEEQEARRLQKKRLAKMADEDFMFNEDEWLAEKPEEAEDSEVVTEVLKDIEIPEDMSSEERLRILQSRYPELDYLAEELLELQPLLVILQKEAEGQTRKTVATVKYRVLGCYVATLAMYFATLTSPVRDSNGSAKSLDPAELRDHEVMGTLLECREAWQRVKDLKSSKAAEPAASILTPPEEETTSVDNITETSPKLSKASSRTNKEMRKAKQAERKAKEVEESLADLSVLVTKSSKLRKPKSEAVTDDNSEFGEEEAMDSRAAAEKAARKKSLRFYTSQIVQKANKRAGAGRDAGGDMDIPYRERLRDRQARLNAAAEKRGQKDSKDGIELSDESDNDDQVQQIREDEDGYYDMIASRASSKKSEKKARADALSEASKADKVIQQEVIGEDGKRKITYAIEKNKGLAPKRKKEVRNPRLKKRLKYEEKKKKLGSIKPVYKRMEGNYQGEQTGIKPGLVKSVKLSR